MPKKRDQQEDDMKEVKMYSKEKLEEVLYFLLQMRNSYVNRKHFIHNMNTFLTLTRMRARFQVGNFPFFQIRTLESIYKGGIEKFL